jgi:hypothetical protein
MKNTFFALLLISLFSFARADDALSPKALKLTAATVLTSGAPADIGSITVPNWITRFTLDGGGGGPIQSPCVFVVSTTGSGDLSSATFVIRDGPNGTGQELSNSLPAPSSTSAGTYSSSYYTMNPYGSVVISTSSTIYVNQTTNSANPGAVSVFVILLPLD